MKVHMEPLDSMLDLEADTHRSDLLVPSLLALLTPSLSVETESMGFPIHSSGYISSGSDKAIIMSLIKSRVSQYFVLLFRFV